MSLPAPQLPQLVEVVRDIEARHRDRVERVYGRNFLLEARDYKSGLRRTLASAEMVVFLLDLVDAEHARAECFKAACDERDLLISDLLRPEGEGGK